MGVDASGAAGAGTASFSRKMTISMEENGREPELYSRSDEEVAKNPGRESDLDLLRRANRGEDEAFHELVDRHAEALFGLAFYLVGNRIDAEDVVQETLLGAFRNAGSFEGRSSVETWLRGILMRQAARHHRSSYRRRENKTVSFSEGASNAFESKPTMSAAEASNVRMDVLAGLDELTADHREVIVLREIEGLSYQEIADTLNVPRGTVESRLYRARRELREWLSDYMPE